MKTLIITLSMLFVSTTVVGQTKLEQKRIVRTCLNYKSVRSVYEKDDQGKRPRIMIEDNGVVDDALRIRKFGKRVKFMTATDAFFHNVYTPAFFSFHSLNVNNKTGSADFSIGQVNYSLKLKKTLWGWKVASGVIIDLGR